MLLTSDEEKSGVNGQEETSGVNGQEETSGVTEVYIDQRCY